MRCQGLAPLSPRVGPVLQYLRDRPTPLRGRNNKLQKLPDRTSLEIIQYFFGGGVFGWWLMNDLLQLELIIITKIIKKMFFFMHDI